MYILTRGFCTAAFALFLFFPPDVLAGRHEEWVTAKARVNVVGIKPERARDDAFDLARARAAEKIGRKVSSVRWMLTTENGGVVEQGLTNRILSHSLARTLEEDTLVDRMFIDSLHDGSQVVVREVELRVKLSYWDDPGRSPYTIEAALKPRTRFQEGDVGWLEIKTRKECYLHVFCIAADGQVFVLYPLDRSDISPVPEGTTFVYPQDSTWEFVPLPGHDGDAEDLYVVATKEPLRFFLTADRAAAPGEGYRELARLTLTKLTQEIDEVPPDERGEARVVYEVYAGKR